jgi:hypothetical protein
LQFALSTLIIVSSLYLQLSPHISFRSKTMGKKKVLVSYGVDIDAVSLPAQRAISVSDNQAGRRLARVIWRGGLDK